MTEDVKKQVRAWVAQMRFQLDQIQAVADENLFSIPRKEAFRMAMEWDAVGRELAAAAKRDGSPFPYLHLFACYGILECITRAAANFAEEELG